MNQSKNIDSPFEEILESLGIFREIEMDDSENEWKYEWANLKRLLASGVSESANGTCMGFF